MNGSADSPSAQEVTKLAVVHWFPLEQFPPVQNLLQVVADDPGLHCLCLTTSNDRNLPEFNASPVTIRRRGFPSRSRGRLMRMWLLLSFPWWALWQLIRCRPDAILYFEPHSSAAAFLYLLFNRRCRLLIHYHEYREPKEFYDRGNRLFGLYHLLERKFLYQRAVWISQTNSDRVRMFLQDTPEAAPQKLRALPNYPPQSWHQKRPPVAASAGPLRLLYVGAASIRDTFIREVVDWVMTQPEGVVTLSVYVSNTDEETRDLLQDAMRLSRNISVNLQAIPYQQLPNVLSVHDVGLILYRGNTPNYVYNAPNKLFEYLSCGLDVWFPACMLGVLPYIRTEMAPRVLETNFQKLSSLDLQDRRSQPLQQAQWTMNCETALQPLLHSVKGCVTATDYD